MATKLSKTTLKQLFADGERPTGDNFESAWMSFLNQNDDQISYNGTNNNIELGPNTGIVLGNPTVGVTAGTLRFNGGTGTVQFCDGSVFKDIAGSAGAFGQVGGGTAVAFGGGNVGIGAFPAPPTHLLDVPLSNNSGTGQQILLGNLVIHNGVANDGAYIGNNEAVSNALGYALNQNGLGKTTINAPSTAGSQLSLAIDGDPKLTISPTGGIQFSQKSTVSILGKVNIGSAAIGSTLMVTNNIDNNTTDPTIVPGCTLTVNGDTTGNAGAIPTLIVNGIAQKQGGGQFVGTSDRRVKKEIRPFNEGLQKLLLFDPVVYKFNGKGGTIDNGKDYIGLIAQDVREVMPELTISQFIKLHAEDTNESEVLGHDLSPLTFIFINAIKELNARLEKLEKSKRNEKRKTGNSPGTDH